MDNRKRRIFFLIFTSFFLLLLPLIVILSLGYGFDLKTAQVSNNLTLKIETYPRTAELKIANNKFTSPAELRVPAGKEVTLEIKKPGFKAETFSLGSQKSENSTAYIDGLWLLPDNFQNEFQVEDSRILTILDQNRLLIQKNQNYFISNYLFSSTFGDPEPIRNQSNKNLETLNWKQLSRNIYWQPKENLILYSDSQNNWEILELGILNHQFRAVVSLQRNDLLLLDSETNLWFFNIESRQLTFLDKGFLGLAFTESPQSIWLLDRQQIYKLDSQNTNINTLSNIKNSVFSNVSSILDATREIDPANLDNLVTKNLFLGLVFKIGENTIYISDSDKSKWQIISKNTQIIGTSGSTIFWLDKQNQLYSYDLLTEHKRSFQLPDLDPNSPEDYQIIYYAPWKRLLIYTKTQVIGFWINTQVTNVSIRRYSHVSWIENQNCLPKIQENYQFCTSQNKIFSYRNNSLPFP